MMLLSVITVHLTTLNEIFPKENLSDYEEYSQLLSNLNKLSINTTGELRTILESHYKEIMAAEKRIHKANKEEGLYTPANRERIDSGVYFTHVGLARNGLSLEFGEEEFYRILSDDEK